MEKMKKIDFEKNEKTCSHGISTELGLLIYKGRHA
jgi:hypothetical protein